HQQIARSGALAETLHRAGKQETSADHSQRNDLECTSGYSAGNGIQITSLTSRRNALLPLPSTGLRRAGVELQHKGDWLRPRRRERPGVRGVTDQTFMNPPCVSAARKKITLINLDPP